MDPYVATLSILVFICKTRVRTRTLGLAVTVVCSTVRKAPCTLLGTGQMFSPWQVSFLLLCILSLRGWQGCVVDSCHPGRVCLMPCPPGAGGAHGYNDGRKGSLLLSAFIECHALCWAMGRKKMDVVPDHTELKSSKP